MVKKVGSSLNSDKFAIITLLWWLSFVHYSIRSGVADVRHMLNLKMKVGLGTGKLIERVVKCIGTITLWIQPPLIGPNWFGLRTRERSLSLTHKAKSPGGWEVYVNSALNKSELEANTYNCFNCTERRKQIIAMSHGKFVTSGGKNNLYRGCETCN